MSDKSRCWTCQAYLSADQQDESGFYCPNCGDRPNAVELESNGWEYKAGVWVRN